MIRRPPRYTRTYPLVPYTALFRARSRFSVLPREYVRPVSPVLCRQPPLSGLTVGTASGSPVPVGAVVHGLGLTGRGLRAAGGGVGIGDGAARARDADRAGAGRDGVATGRSEEHTSELQSLMRSSYAVFCLTKKKNKQSTR